MEQSNKGQGLPLNTIIIAIIVIVVLVIVILLFTGQMASWFHTTSSCEAKSGSCVSSKDQCSGTVITEATCPQKNPVCCVTLPGSGGNSQ